MSSVTLRYFAAARERAGCSEERVLLADGAPVRELLQALCTLHPALVPLLPHLRVAVNQEFSSLDAKVPAGAEVALIPPVAGGSGDPAFLVTDAPLSLDAVVRAVSGKGQGGVVTFSGAVRDATSGKSVVRLEYEAYAPMAEKKLAEIASEAAAQWPGARVAIHHRVGVLSPGELAVVIAASTPHRAEAFAACRHAIERLKADVPIWKKEVYADGAVWVGLGP
ncbi:MAG: Molybdenum cofactor biosynthesis protein MoaD / Molybdenum cofactor biosynthesis protein MoaE [Myxococcaceae bacterium]|nr:Molybdenum cofactor biosynthesis protein MoaD / Molybdenum cofactor biosynthesis protein MoaE [Myxococcaceae bacterium]